MNVTKFRKGFTDPRLHERFIAAVADGDLSEIDVITNASGTARRFVDAGINGMPRAIEINRRVVDDAGMTPAPEFGSAEYMEGVQLVLELAKQRDLPLKDINAPERGYTDLSPFLSDVMIPKYTTGVDYGTTKDTHALIQSGADLAGLLQVDRGRETAIQTGRDAAAYVHTDNPLLPWLRFVNHLLSNGVKPRRCAAMEGLDVQADFVTYGMPFFIMLLGESIGKAGWCSFYVKWRDFAPRPEESTPVLTGEYLPLAFPEGSPMHCSDHSMHSVATCTCKELMLQFFDGSAEMPVHGETIGSRAQQLADNVGLFRVHAGVHFPWEHTRADERAKRYAEIIAEPYLR